MKQTDFIARLKLLAKVCDFQLPMELVLLYDKAMSRFGYDAAVAAIEAAILERRGHEKMPSIGDLAHRCSPQIDERGTAVEVSGRIIAAVTKFGWANARDAADWIGEVGWAVVDRNGGWESLCQSMREKDVPTWRAQLREQAASVIQRHKAGVLGAAPKFGEVAAAPRMAALVGGVLKKSEEYDGQAGKPRGVPQEPSSGQLDAQDAVRVTEALQGAG